MKFDSDPYGPIEHSAPITIVNCFDDDNIDYASETDSVMSPLPVQQFQQAHSNLDFVNCDEMDNTEVQYSLIPKMENANNVPCKCNDDGLEMFFGSIISTIRQFPPVEIARMKIEINNIVGAKEVALLRGTHTDEHTINKVKLDGSLASGIYRFKEKK